MENPDGPGIVDVRGFPDLCRGRGAQRAVLLGNAGDMVAGLAFWDLDAFYWRLSRVKACDETRLVEKAHGKRLMIALSAGALLGAEACYLR